MRTLLLAVWILAVSAVPSSAQRWHVVGTDRTGRIYAIDSTTASRAGDHVTFWSRSEAAAPETDSSNGVLRQFSQELVRFRGNCVEHSGQILSMLRRDAAGATLWQSNQAGTEQGLVPGSMVELVLDAACQLTRVH